MRLSFVGITPDTPDSQCPAVYVDEDTGDLWFQGPAVTDQEALVEVARHSPIGATESVVRLPAEMRDSYTPSDPWFCVWLAGDREEFERRLSRPWLGLIREVTGRGVQVRRARVISEPVTSYVRFEHATTSSNVEAGEQVGWLPRRLASGLLLPGNDFWVFDTRLVLFWFFSGDGDFAGAELSDDLALVKQCAGAFDAVWQHAIPHPEYRLA